VPSVEEKSALHADHSLDEADRRLRERRLKQINVACEIVSGKRRSLWPLGQTESIIASLCMC
jgi:hypothetical protein